MVKNDARPPINTLSKRGTLVGAFVLAALLLVACGSAPQPAWAENGYGVQRTGFDDIPAYDISVIDPTGFDIEQAQMETTIPGLSIVKERTENDASKSGWWIHIIRHLDPSEELSVEGSVSLTWPERGIDANGNKYDVRVMLSNIRMSVASWRGAGDYDITLFSNWNLADEEGYYLCASCSTQDNGVSAGLGGHVHAKIEFLDAETGEPASNKTFFYANDIDQGDTLGNGHEASDGTPMPFTEQIDITAGQMSDLYVTSDTYLKTDGSKVWGTKEDSDTERSGVGFIADAGGLEFDYTEAGGSMVLFSPLREHTITVATTGNGTSDPKESAKIFWKQNRSVLLLPDEGYHVAGLAVDGAPRAIATMIPFESVTRDHTVEAAFAPNAYTIRFDANGASGSMFDQNMTYDVAGNLSANAFDRAGWRFTGWNTAPDGSGTSFADRQSVINLTSQENGTVTLFAQWEQKRYTVEIPTKIAYTGMPAGKADVATSFKVKVYGDFDGTVNVSSKDAALTDGNTTLQASTASSEHGLSFAEAGSAADSVHITGYATSLSEWQGTVAYQVANQLPESA